MKMCRRGVVQLDLTRNLQQSVRDIFDWLRVEFGVEKPGNKLEDFAVLSEADFIWTRMPAKQTES